MDIGPLTVPSRESWSRGREMRQRQREGSHLRFAGGRADEQRSALPHLSKLPAAVETLARAAIAAIAAIAVWSKFKIATASMGRVVAT